MFPKLVKKDEGYIEDVIVNDAVVDIRVSAPKFAPGDEVEVYHRRIKKWCSATIMYSTLEAHVIVREDEIRVHAWVWRHICQVILTGRVDEISVAEGHWRDSNDIRAVQQS